MRSPFIVASIFLGCTSAALSGRSNQPEAQLAHLNHFFVTVDHETAEAIGKSPFMRTFANFEIKTTTGGQASWTGRYLRGKKTYIEFFAPKDFDVGGAPAPVGAWGIGLSGDRQGDLAKVQERIEADGHKAIRYDQTKKVGNKALPWFTALMSDSAGGNSGDENAPITVWAMEYDEAYFALPEAEKEPASGPHDVVSRERYQSDAYAQKMMQDVTFVEFALTPAHFRRIEPMLKAAGFRLLRSGSRIDADGAETDFRFLLTSGELGVRRIGFSLNRPVRRRIEELGRSTLTIGPGQSGSWVFRPSHKK